MTPRESKKEPTMTTETPAEVLAHPIQPLEIDERGTLRFKKNAIVRHLLDHGGIDMNDLAVMDFSPEDREQFAQLIGYSHDGAGTLSYFTDKAWYAAQEEYESRGSERSLAAGKVATHAVFARSDEYPEPVCLTGYVGTESEIASKVMEMARREGYRGTFADRMKELGWWIAPVFTAPPADPAKASEPEYDRSLIAEMLYELSKGGEKYTYDAIRKQMELLRAADNAHAAKVRTVRASGSAPVECARKGTGRHCLAPACMCSDAMDRQAASAPDGCGACGNGCNGGPCRVLQDSPPASAPEVTEDIAWKVLVEYYGHAIAKDDEDVERMRGIISAALQEPRQ
jgi:hypothetical protein